MTDTGAIVVSVPPPVLALADGAPVTPRRPPGCAGPSGDGRWSGHVDLGELGVADRWADLAVATWSTTWNYGPGWEIPLLDAYGVPPDPPRTRFYRLLWDLGP